LSQLIWILMFIHQTIQLGEFYHYQKNHLLQRKSMFCIAQIVEVREKRIHINFVRTAEQNSK